MAKGSNALDNLHCHNIDIKEREIYIHNYLEDGAEEGGINHKTYASFHKNLRLLDGISNKPIIVHINSPGGVWADGLAMYDAIKLTKSRSIGIAYGDVSSSASIILQAFHLRLVTRNTVMVVHAGSAAFHGTVSGCLAYAHNEQRQTEVMLKLYAERNTAEKYQNKSTKEIVDDLNKRILMKEDIYLIGREIVEEGFADGIMGEGDYPDYECLKN